MPAPRIVSLLPSATEMLFAIGAGDLLVGRSHECDWPPAAVAPALQATPVLTRARIAHTAAATAEEAHAIDSAAIDAQVRAALSTGESLYELDEALLAALRPDVILTQDLCSVCSIDLRSVQRVAATLPHPPRVVSLNPCTLWQVLDDLLVVGEATGRTPDAERAMTALRDRIWTAHEQCVPYADGPSVLFLEWTDPPFVGGHWTPELITMAGGRHPLNAAGSKSRVATPAEIVASAPERIVVCPCGFGIQAIRTAMPALAAQPWWAELPAVRAAQRGDIGSVMLVDGNQMFNRPGPRLVDALEWLTAWLNARPALAPADFPALPWQPSAAATA